MPADFKIHSIADNGEFITTAKVDLILDGKVVATESFVASSEFENDGTAVRLASSFAVAWCESQEFTMEERLGPFGIEWEREQDERRVA